MLTLLSFGTQIKNKFEWLKRRAWTEMQSSDKSILGYDQLCKTVIVLIISWTCQFTLPKGKITRCTVHKFEDRSG